MQRLRASGTSLSGSAALAQLRKKAFNSWAAVQDTFFSTKDIFERHRVVFTVGTSIASVATAWFGYSLRHLHESRVDQRLESIEKAMKNSNLSEHSEIRKIVDAGSFSTPACFATAGTTLIIGYGLGWRGGRWYANRQFRKEQMKMLGQLKPKRWQLLGRVNPRGLQLKLPFLRRPLVKSRAAESATKVPEKMKDAPTACSSGGTHPSSAAIGTETRTKLLSVHGRDSQSYAFKPSEDDGICSSMVEKQGYVCEEHTVTTQDGYILSIQRIPAGRPEEKAESKLPVLLQHGLLMDGVTWLLLPPHQSLALLLADNGFDVWIANTRGTKYSRGHVSLSPDDGPYWNWSWDELVAYDLPATLQYVHEQTGQKLHYVGHSLGTLIALAAFSEEQLLNMLRSAALLSPIAHVGQMTSPLARNAAENFFAEKLYWLGIHEFVPRGEAVIKLLKDICKKPGIDCTDLLTSFTGVNCCLNPSIVDIFLDHEPQSTATKNMVHLAQMIRDGTITMFNYGNEDENRKHYGQPYPPDYNVTSFPNDLPLFLSYGGKDALSDTKDVHLLLERLKDHDGDKLVVQYRDDYAHADYVMGENAKQVVYDPLIAFFRLQ
ncbi:Serine aminopeptidase [Parasponia andersonii]|uniref:Serine aminopeptidase n=1 Tax=Parasponia andersonii TaxID=3476 RepID=A0A2P5ARY4_PARAD|nr:Serine aminopeptidase [Parasponia andersonii]